MIDWHWLHDDDDDDGDDDDDDGPWQCQEPVAAKWLVLDLDHRIPVPKRCAKNLRSKTKIESKFRIFQAPNLLQGLSSSWMDAYNTLILMRTCIYDMYIIFLFGSLSFDTHTANKKWNGRHGWNQMMDQHCPAIPHWDYIRWSQIWKQQTCNDLPWRPNQIKKQCVHCFNDGITRRFGTSPCFLRFNATKRVPPNLLQK